MYLKISFRHTFIVAFGLIAGIISCSDDGGDSKSVPAVETKAITDLTTTSAVSGGTIKSDGGATVRFSGLAYSATNNEPTIEDDTTRTTVGTGSFTAKLKSLTPSTTYYVRAYAANSVGTGYGDVVQFSTGNGVPTVTNIVLDGDVEVNGELTASYNYSDAENNPEGETTFQWYVADDATGAGEEAIDGEILQTYKIQEFDEGKYVRVGITPKATVGTLIGNETKSAFVGAVGEATTVKFDYMGDEVIYGILNSPTTGRKWLDRNLGSPGVASTIDDYQNYGDLFQWGRGEDGHQIVSRTGASDMDATGSSTTTTQSTTDDPSNALFIFQAEDWRDPQNSNLWQGNNGINNPCPNGWRLPTLNELQAETLGSLSKGFSDLKFTLTGFRLGGDANFYASDLYGYYWTSTVPIDSPTESSFFSLGTSTEFSGNIGRSSAMACRCTKE